LASILTDRLKELNRTEWYEQSRDRMVKGTRETRLRDEENLWRITGYAALSQRGWAILKALWHWRDSEARQWDRPAFHVLSNESLLRLADDASRGSGFSRPRIPQPRADRMEETLEAALLLPESEWPKVIRSVRTRVSKEQIDRFNHLRDFRDKVARDVDLDPSIIAPKAALEAVATDPSAAILLPWQRALLKLPAPHEKAPEPVQPNLL